MKEIPGGWPNSWWRRGSSPDESTLSVERLIQSFSYKQPQDIKKSFFFKKNLSQTARTSPRPPHRPAARAWKRRTCTGNHHRHCHVGECRASGCDGRTCIRREGKVETLRVERREGVVQGFWGEEVHGRGDAWRSSGDGGVGHGRSYLSGEVVFQKRGDVDELGQMGCRASDDPQFL